MYLLFEICTSTTFREREREKEKYTFLKKEEKKNWMGKKYVMFRLPGEITVGAAVSTT